MTFEDQIAEVLEDRLFEEVKERARIRQFGKDLSDSMDRTEAEFVSVMEAWRTRREGLARDITGYAEEIVTGIEYYPLPKLFHESRLPHEAERQDDPMKLYPEAAE